MAKVCLTPLCCCHPRPPQSTLVSAISGGGDTVVDGDFSRDNGLTAGPVDDGTVRLRNFGNAGNNGGWAAFLVDVEVVYSAARRRARVAGLRRVVRDGTEVDLGEASNFAVVQLEDASSESGDGPLAAGAGEGRSGIDAVLSGAVSGPLVMAGAVAIVAIACVGLACCVVASRSSVRRAEAGKTGVERQALLNADQQPLEPPTDAGDVPADGDTRQASASASVSAAASSSSSSSSSSASSA